MIKRYFSFVVVVSTLVFFSCNKENEKQQDVNSDIIVTDTAVKQVVSQDTATAITTEMPLMAASDCYTCHKDKEDLVGPSFEKIALKYKSTPQNLSMLADKVINGGVGNWGQVPMQAHPTLKKDDVVKMIEYILATK